jgi:hypothetical protein
VQYGPGTVRDRSITLIPSNASVIRFLRIKLEI